MRAPTSLRRELVQWLLPLYLLTGLLLGWKFYEGYRKTIDRFMDGQMEAMAETARAHRCETLPPLRPLSEIDVHEDGHFALQLWCEASPTPQASALPGVGIPLQAEPGWRDLSAAGQTWRVYTAATALPGGPRVQVLQSLVFREAEVVGRALFASIPAVSLLLISLAVLWLVIGRTSRRLRLAAESLAHQGDTQRDTPAGPLATAADVAPQVPAELAPLVRAFEAMLARLHQALEAQRRFVQDAAHELRTPLTALQLQLENLRPTSAAAPVPVPDPEAYRRMQQGMARARHLVDKLLTLSRQEVGQRGALESLDLRALLRDCVADALPLADERQLDIAFVDHAPGPVSLSGVAQDLRSLFGNLLDNAIRHSPPGGEIELRLIQTSEGQRRVEIQDAGPGLPPALRERVFDRFYRAPDAPPGGSGLGLAIARQAGLRHGLRIELRGREDGQHGLVARVCWPSP